MLVDKRRIAVAFCAIGAFLHLYAPQAVLPMMAREYGVGAADASLIITAGTLAVAATAPFTGALSDVIGRKRLIVVAMALLLIPAFAAPPAGAVIGYNLSPPCGCPRTTQLENRLLLPTVGIAAGNNKAVVALDMKLLNVRF